MAKLLKTLAPWRMRLAQVSRLSVEAHLESNDPESLGPFAKFSKTAKNRDLAYFRACKQLQDKMFDASSEDAIARAFLNVCASGAWDCTTRPLELATKGSDAYRFIARLRWVLTHVSEAWSGAGLLAKNYKEPGSQFFWAALRLVGYLKNSIGREIESAAWEFSPDSTSGDHRSKSRRTQKREDPRASRVTPGNALTPPAAVTRRTARDDLSLTDLHRALLRAMRSAECVDFESRKRSSAIASLANRSVQSGRTSSAVRTSLSELVKRGLAETKAGRGGGYWLTPQGQRTAEELA